MNLLIPYVHIPGHEDPQFSEYTYGDASCRARKLKASLTAGEFVLSHTTLRYSLLSPKHKESAIDTCVSAYSQVEDGEVEKA